MRKILIIGGTRYLGLEITRRFAESRQNEVYVLNRGRRQPDLPSGVQRITCDANNVPQLISIVTDLKPDILADTILGSNALDKLLPRLGGWLKGFIHTGSIGVYGGSGWIPAKEDDLPVPLQPVFREKFAQDEVILRHIKKNGLPATILRMSYIYGRGDVPLELWGGRNPEFFRMLQKEVEIPVPGDGTQLLHPGHVTDLASAFTACLDNNACKGRIYNIAGDRSITVSAYLELIGKALGVTPLVSWRPASEVSGQLVDDGYADINDLQFFMKHMSVDITRAKTELGYNPTVNLEEGLKDNINWMHKEDLIR